MKIAVAGKGGVGKSTISAALSRYFAARGFEIYAVDADPDLSLGTVLGLPDAVLENLRPVSEMHDVIKEKSRSSGAFFSLNPEVGDLLDSCSIHFDNIRFLKMGALKKGGTSCYCRENSILHALMRLLLLDKKEMVLLDLGAGIEHLTRGTAGGVDLMLIVSEPTPVSLKTATTIEALATDLGIPRTAVVINKVTGADDRELYRSVFGRQDVLGEIDDDSEVRRRYTSELFNEAIEKIGRKILEMDLYTAEGVGG